MLLAKELLLQREKSNYTASFCIINEDLQKLSKRLVCLSPSEYAYYQNLRFDKRKHSYLLGRIAAKEAVMALSDKKLNYKNFFVDFGVFQFPVVKNTAQNIQVSISHCDDYGVSLAFPEDHPLGIDMEKIDHDKAHIIDTTLTSHEKKCIKANFVDVAEGNTVFWTIKESLSKIIKTGFTTDPEVFEIKSIKKSGNQFICDFKNFYQYKSVSYTANNYACTVVLPKKTSLDCHNIWLSFESVVRSKN
jgi:4'-phosphopantetheinyl transferase